jgi:hypothetical protein
VRSLRLAAAAVSAATLAAGCGGGEAATTPSEPSTVSATAPPALDPGREALQAFVFAAREDRVEGMWRLLSTVSRQRLGPTLSAFRKETAHALRKEVGFARFRVAVSERITPELGVVALDGTRVTSGARERSVYAAVLRLEGSRWKLELGGPVRIRPIGPDPGARERVVAQVAAAVEGPGGNGTAVMYVDGQTVSPTVAGTARDATLYANLEPGLGPGRHTVVVFASDGREASAAAWSFRVVRG